MDGFRPKDAEKTGEVFGNDRTRQAEMERCTISNVHPKKHTCSVITESGNYIADVQWPGDKSNVPERGEQYSVTYGLGKPSIVETTEPSRSKDSTTSKVKSTISDNIGGDNFAYDRESGGSPNPDMPQDTLPGDWIKMGDAGQMLGVLEGGTTVMRASELAQIIATKARHLIKLMGKNISLMSGGGTLDFKTEDGKSSVVFRTGSDEETETHPSEENFRIRCELGDEGQLVDFRVTDHKGHVKYRHHVDEEGQVDSQKQRETERIKEDKRTDIGDDHNVSVGGTENRDVQNDKNEDIHGSLNQNISGRARVKSAKQMALQSLKDLTLTARKNVDVTATGALLPGEGLGSNTSVSFTAVNGGVSFDVGNPANGDTFVNSGDFSVDTYRGDIKLESKLGNIELKTYRPGSVKLGGPAPGAFSGMLYETFLSFMTLFGTMVDTHTHQVNSVGSPTTPPLTPAFSTASSLLPLIRSKFVKFGG